MTGFICGPGLQPVPVTLPDAGSGECCMEAVLDGPQACTCWKPVYRQEQEPAKAGPSNVQPRPCADCAYRGDSPERNGDDSFSGDWGELEDLAISGRPFYCHAGMRRKERWEHPSGAVVEGHPGDYDPPVIDGVPRKADGSPADLCGGWHARARHWQRELEREAACDGD